MYRTYVQILGTRLVVGSHLTIKNSEHRNNPQTAFGNSKLRMHISELAKLRSVVNCYINTRIRYEHRADTCMIHCEGKRITSTGCTSNPSLRIYCCESAHCLPAAFESRLTDCTTKQCACRVRYQAPTQLNTCMPTVVWPSQLQNIHTPHETTCMLRRVRLSGTDVEIKHIPSTYI